MSASLDVRDLRKQFAIGRPAVAIRSYSGWNQLTPSFFCRLDDEVVYWNTSRLSG